MIFTLKFKTMFQQNSFSVNMISLKRINFIKASRLYFDNLEERKNEFHQDEMTPDSLSDDGKVKIDKLQVYLDSLVKILVTKDTLR